MGGRRKSSEEDKGRGGGGAPSGGGGGASSGGASSGGGEEDSPDGDSPDGASISATGVWNCKDCELGSCAFVPDKSCLPSIVLANSDGKFTATHGYFFRKLPKKKKSQLRSSDFYPVSSDIRCFFCSGGNVRFLCHECIIENITPIRWYCTRNCRSQNWQSHSKMHEAISF